MPRRIGTAILAMGLVVAFQGLPLHATEHMQSQDDGTLAPPGNERGTQPYVTVRATLGAGAGRMTSASYESMATVGQVSPAGAASACNTGNRTTVGFWSVLGHGAVPIVLAAMREASDPTGGTVNLNWSGADSVFQIYRDFDPSDLVIPANLDHETTACSTTDPNAFQSDIVFYRIIAAPEGDSR